MKDLVSICLHTGKIENILMFQNAIKSFVANNTYPNVELVLIESSQNQKVRSWIDGLDLNNFVNFDGTNSLVKPNTNVNIQLLKIYSNFEDFYDQKTGDKMWWVPFIKSLDKALDQSNGKYFTYLAEDIQFIVKGDVISDYIQILKKEGEETSMIHFVTQHMYKYLKNNNRYEGPYFVNDVKYYNPVEVKWDLNVFCNKSLIYKKLGPIVDWNIMHGMNENYTKISREIGLKRFYPEIYPAMWFHNNHKDELLKILSENNKKNSDYLLFESHNHEEIKAACKDATRPLSTEDFQKVNLK